MEETLVKLKALMENHQKLEVEKVRLMMEENSSFTPEPYDKKKIAAEEKKKLASGDPKAKIKIIIYTLIAFFVYVAFFMCDYFFKWEFVFKTGEKLTMLKIFTSFVAVLCYTGVTFLIIKVVVNFKNKKQNPSNEKENKQLEEKYKAIYDQKIKEQQEQFEKEKADNISKIKEEIANLQKLVDEQDIVDEKCNKGNLVTHIYTLFQLGAESDMQKACADALNRKDIDDGLKTIFCSALLSPETPEYKNKLVKDAFLHLKDKINLLSDEFCNDIENKNSKTKFYFYMMPYIGTLRSTVLDISTEIGFNNLFNEIKLVYEFYSKQESVFSKYKEMYGDMLNTDKL